MCVVLTAVLFASALHREDEEKQKLAEKRAEEQKKVALMACALAAELKTEYGWDARMCCCGTHPLVMFVLYAESSR